MWVYASLTNHPIDFRFALRGGSSGCFCRLLFYTNNRRCPAVVDERTNATRTLKNLKSSPTIDVVWGLDALGHSYSASGLFHSPSKLIFSYTAE